MSVMSELAYVILNMPDCQERYNSCTEYWSYNIKYNVCTCPMQEITWGVILPVDDTCK